MIEFKAFRNCSKPYLNNSKYESGYVYISNPDSFILLSAPHGVKQTRLGKSKFSEIGSARLAITLSQLNNTNLIIKTKHMFDDANFDIKCGYRTKISNEIKKNNIKYLFDIHGLASYRDCDINLGISLGNNIKTNEPLFEKMLNIFKEYGFKVNIDQPFAGIYPTISSTFAKKFNIWTIQVEVNCKITNDFKNTKKLNMLIESLSKCIKLCKEALI